MDKSLRDAWKKLGGVGMIKSSRLVDGKESSEFHYGIGSTGVKTVKTFAHATRAHWGIESVPQAHGKEVQHELTDCVQATWKMRAGPSESAFRRGLQTTPSCCA